ncbi:MAG: hypothetical protein CMJ52_11100 [Planctomycetaceae bacterium]|nr:hypothetical protein [Planctomycetaceae bacterium]
MRSGVRTLETAFRRFSMVISFIRTVPGKSTTSPLRVVESSVGAGTLLDPRFGHEVAGFTDA